MKIIIIEDEFFLAESIVKSISLIRPHYQVIKILPTVESAIDFLSDHSDYDLIFSDIALGDGISFEIFQKIEVRCPVIFITAYEKFAIQAFEVNGIDFLLKPVTEERLEQAFTKVERLIFHFTGHQEKVSKLIEYFNKKTKKGNDSTLIVEYRDQLIPLKLDSIILFYIRDKHTYVIDQHSKHYPVSHTLEELEQIVDDNFFRVNRQVLLHRKSVVNIQKDISRKLILTVKVPFHEEITVGKVKAMTFLKWVKK